MSWYIKTASDRKAIDEGCYWDQEQADAIVRFAETFYVPQFVKAKGFTLLPWQREWLQELYGWRLPNGQRRWRKALLTVSKKNGKNLLTSIVCLYELLASDTPSPLVISASTTRENARQILDELRNCFNRQERLKKLVEAKKVKILPSTKIIKYPSKNGEFRSISNDSGNAEGLNCSMVICDEVHAWQSDKLFRTLEYSTVSRADGCLVIISTAGNDMSSFFFDLKRKADAVLGGSDTDTSFFARVYECPENLTDTEEGWRLANPSLGVAFSLEDFRRDAEAAGKDTASRLSFQRYRLNQWRSPADGYIDGYKWDACKNEITEEILKKCPLWVAADLSQTTDPCSVSLVWALPDRTFYVRNHAWVCRAGVEKRDKTNLPSYRQWEADGVLTITNGTANDYPAIKQYIMDARSKGQFKEVIFDAYNAIEMAVDLMSKGMVVYRQPQNHKAYNSPTKEFQIAVNEKRIMHDGNRFLRWCLINTRLHIDAQENVKPDRETSTDKIDGTISTLMAYARAVEQTAKKVTSVYETRGIRWIS